MRDDLVMSSLGLRFLRGVSGGGRKVEGRTQQEEKSTLFAGLSKFPVFESVWSLTNFCVSLEGHGTREEKVSFI